MNEWMNDKNIFNYYNFYYVFIFIFGMLSDCDDAT